MSLDSVNSKSAYSKLEPVQKTQKSEITQATEILEKSKSGEPIKMDDGSWGGLKDTAKEIGKLGKAQTSINIDHGGCELGTIHKIFSNHDPKTIVESVRNSKGAEHDNSLLGFKDKVDNLSNNELKDMRDYIGNEMASPKNKDDELLGSMLKVVNKEIDSRDQKPHFIDLGPVKPIQPRPWNEVQPIDLEPHHKPVLDMKPHHKQVLFDEKVNIKGDPFSKVDLSPDNIKEIKEKLQKID